MEQLSVSDLIKFTNNPSLKIPHYSLIMSVANFCCPSIYSLILFHSQKEESCVAIVRLHNFLIMTLNAILRDGSQFMSPKTTDVTASQRTLAARKHVTLST